MTKSTGITAGASSGNRDAIYAHLREERDRFVAFAFASSDIVLELEADGHVTFVDGALHSLLGYRQADAIGKPITDWLSDDDKASFAETFSQLQTERRLEPQSIPFRSAFGDSIAMQCSGFFLNGKIFLSLSIPRGAQAGEPALMRNQETGLLSKNGFVQKANERIQQAKANGESLSVTLVQLPELAELLNTLSSEQSSALLSEISQHLRAHSVDGDMAGQIDEESFSLLQDESHSPSQILGRLIELTRQYDPAKAGLEATIKSVDANSSAMTSRDSANVLLHTLNKFAKSKGDDFSITDLAGSYDALVAETVERVRHFKQTVTDEAFTLAFQPIVELQNGLIHHFETLVRVHDPDIFKNPFEFITFGEEAGVISEFDLIMIEKTFDVLAQSSKKGNNPVVAVNISGKSMSSLMFRDMLAKLLDRHGKYRKQMIFEFTESAKMEDLATINGYIQQLRSGGTLCCLDDFGTGESSFDYLRSLEVDFIKIDGSYVRESVQTPRGRHMLKAMAGLCRDLRVTTIGEMVEDEEAANALWDCGIKFGQGYLFGKPEIDVETLVNCKKPTPFFGGILRARKIKN